jgi:alpha-ketoglutarate-dependent taurine dioxygenase
MAAENTAENITVKKAGVHLGAEIAGLDLRRKLDDDAHRAVHDALVEHALIIFHDQDITADQLIRILPPTSSSPSANGSVSCRCIRSRPTTRTDRN